MENKAELIFDQVVYETVRLMFSDGNVSDANLRLVRLALQHNKLDIFIMETIKE